MAYISTRPSTPDPYGLSCAAQAPIVIDNGSTTLRWGAPAAPAANPNAVVKYKECMTINPMLFFSEAINVERRAGAGAVNTLNS